VPRRARTPWPSRARPLGLDPRSARTGTRCRRSAGAVFNTEPRRTEDPLRGVCPDARCCVHRLGLARSSALPQADGGRGAGQAPRHDPFAIFGTRPRRTPFPPNALPPSRSLTASCSPVDAPDGTAARPNAPESSRTSTSTVGLPQLSRICRACTEAIELIANRPARHRRWLPFSPLAHLLGFVPLPASFLAALALMIVLYLLLVELGKIRFYRVRPHGQPLARRRPSREHWIHHRAARRSIPGRPLRPPPSPPA
jgi:hypothetical protein